MRRVDELMKDQNVHMIDCRFTPHSWRSAWCKAALEEHYKDHYHWAGPWLGNAKHPTNQMFPCLVEIELIDPKRGIAGLLYYLRRGHDLILLCKCLEYRYCHLKEVVRLLQEALPEVEVILPLGPPAPVENPYKFANGAKVYAKLKGKEKTPAVVLESAFSPEGNYDQCRLRVAQWHELGQKWLVSDYPRPVQSYKLSKRGTIVPGLDE